MRIRKATGLSISTGICKTEKERSTQLRKVEKLRPMCLWEENTRKTWANVFHRAHNRLRWGCAQTRLVRNLSREQGSSYFPVPNPLPSSAQPCSYTFYLLPQPPQFCDTKQSREAKAGRSWKQEILFIISSKNCILTLWNHHLASPAQLPKYNQVFKNSQARKTIRCE